jgi:hypothetical protein
LELSHDAVPYTTQHNKTNKTTNTTKEKPQPSQPTLLYCLHRQIEDIPGQGNNLVLTSKCMRWVVYVAGRYMAYSHDFTMDTRSTLANGFDTPIPFFSALSGYLGQNGVHVLLNQTLCVKE